MHLYFEYPELTTATAAVSPWRLTTLHRTRCGDFPESGRQSLITYIVAYSVEIKWLGGHEEKRQEESLTGRGREGQTSFTRPRDRECFAGRWHTAGLQKQRVSLIRALRGAGLKRPSTDLKEKQSLKVLSSAKYCFQPFKAQRAIRVAKKIALIFHSSLSSSPVSFGI